MAKSGFNIADYNKNLTPEEKEARRLKAAETRKKNKLEEKVMAKSMKKAVTQKYKICLADGKYVYVSGSDMIAKAMVTVAGNPLNKHCIEAATFVRDSIGEKPVETKAITASFTWEDMVDKLTKKETIAIETEDAEEE